MLILNQRLHDIADSRRKTLRGKEGTTFCGLLVEIAGSSSINPQAGRRGIRLYLAELL